MRMLNILVLTKMSRFLATVFLSDSARAIVLTAPGPSHLTNSLSQFLTKEHGQTTMIRLAVGSRLDVMDVLSKVYMRQTDWSVFPRPISSARMHPCPLNSLSPMTH